MSDVQRVALKLKSGRTAKRKQRSPRWETFTDMAREKAAVITVPIAKGLERLGVHPNTLTIVGMLLQAVVGVVFALGHIVLGGWLLLAIAPVDALDGALARASGRQSLFGAFLDSTLDRLSDAVLILGLATHYMLRQEYLPVALLLISLVAALLVSYTRARAEALGLPCKVGLLTRLERILLIATLCALGLPLVMIWLLMTLSVFTVFQRVLHVYAASRRIEGE